MDHPLISVIMSVYKEPLSWISQSINSILNQTFTNFEFIIINDNPLDRKLKEFLNEYHNQDNRIILFNNRENIGLTKSLNIGLRRSRGKYIARMDADDIAYPNRFDIQVDYMESHPDVIVCGSKVKYFGKKSYFHYNTFFENDIDIRGQMMHNSGFAHPTVLIRRKILTDNNILYDENYRTAQDYKLWYDLRKLGKFTNIDMQLLKYRSSENQISSKKISDQISNRDKVRHLFLSEYIRNNCNSNFQNTNKLLNSYLIRTRAHSEGNFRNILKFILNTHTAATLKEKIIVTLLYIKHKIANTKSSIE